MIPARPAPRIAHVLLFPNGMVAVCDQAGQQIPEYQGRHANVVETILRHAPPETIFAGCSRAEFATWSHS